MESWDGAGLETLMYRMFLAAGLVATLVSFALGSAVAGVIDPGVSWGLDRIDQRHNVFQRRFSPLTVR